MSDWDSANLKEILGKVRSLREQLEDERATVQALIVERDALADRVAELDAHRRTVLKHFLRDAGPGLA